VISKLPYSSSSSKRSEAVAAAMPAAAVQWAELAAPQRGCIGQHLQGKSKKVAPPPMTFDDIFARV